MAYDIFISYRRKDSNGVERGTFIARNIQLALHERGYKNRVFFDHDDIGPEDFEIKILGAIKQSKVFIFVLTQDSLLRCVNEGDWVRREICQAIESKLDIIFINPDGEFIGHYPIDFPEELNVVRRKNHITIHTGSSFNRDMDYLVKDCVNPKINQSSITQYKKALIRIETDLDCRILCFGKEIGLAQAGEYSEIKLPKGKHKLQFVGLENSTDCYECILLVEDVEYEDYIEVKLFDKYNARKEKEAVARQAEQERIAADIQAKEEATRKQYLLTLPDAEFVSFNENNKYGFKLKSTDEIAIPSKYNKVWDFVEGLALVNQWGFFYDKHGYIDKSGEEIITLKYDNATSFIDGMAWVQLNGKWGVIDKKGKDIISIKYDCIHLFAEDLARVKLNGKWGYLNKKGKEVIPLIYDEVKPFSQGLAQVKLNGKCGYIDKKGKYIIPSKYDDIGYICEGLIKVKLNEKWGVIDIKTGEKIISIKYDDLYLFNEGLIRACINGEWFYIDKNGNRIE